MHGWFGGGINVTDMSVQVTTQSNGAGWSGSPNSSTIQLKAQGAVYSNNPAYLRYLLIAEVVEIFMLAQNSGWFQGSNEGSKGEGLSRFLSGQFLAQNGFLGLGIDANYAVADLWLNSTRQDFVNNAPDDNGYDATNGCTTLFIYYLFSQLGYSINQVVGAGASTLAGVYKNLTGDTADPFPLFKSILDLWFPSQTNSAVSGPNFDDPWPLYPVAYSGVWRSGTGPYYLWIHADRNNFVSKWQTLASQNMRLTDIEVTTVNGQDLFSGIWEQGSDGYYLWIDAGRNSFVSKWQTLASQNLRLVSIRHYNGLWAGVWRQGTDGYYLWIDADQNSFISKWQTLAAQNLRLVDFDVYNLNGQTLWAGVWRQGTDGYYLWINSDWSSFVAKWQALAAQNLRLVGVREYNGLWAGIWRSGSDGYYFYGNVSESNFVSKWSALAGQNLRLVDMIATPLQKSGIPSGALELSAAGIGEGVARTASSEMEGRALVAVASGAGAISGPLATPTGGGSTDLAAGSSGIGGGSVSEATLASAPAITATGGGFSTASGMGGGAATASPTQAAGLGGGQVADTANIQQTALNAGVGGGDARPFSAASERSGSSQMRGRGV